MYFLAKKPKTVPRLLDGKYFNIIETNSNSTTMVTKVVAACVICGVQRRGELSSTTNFMEHIRKSHPELVKQVEDYRSRRSNTAEDKETKKQQKTIKEMFKPCTMDDVRFELNLLRKFDCMSFVLIIYDL